MKYYIYSQYVKYQPNFKHNKTADPHTHSHFNMVPAIEDSNAIFVHKTKRHNGFQLTIKTNQTHNKTRYIYIVNKQLAQFKYGSRNEMNLIKIYNLIDIL